MRKIFIPLLMASTMLPAVASAQDRDRSADRRSERSEQQREDRRERSRPQVQTQRSLPTQANDTARERSFGQRGDEQRSDRSEQVRTQRDGGAMRTIDSRTVQRRAPTPGLDGLVGQRNAVEVQRRIENGATDGRRDGRFDRRDDRVEHRRDDRRDDHRDWRRDWRDDHRYDWRSHRDHNRIVFHLGRYYDPYRYSYRRFNVGYNLWPSYYSSQYWLNDPWMYRLPPAYGPYRWVRYYDDALLVNIYSGQVVDVIYSFFW